MFVGSWTSEILEADAYGEPGFELMRELLGIRRVPDELHDGVLAVQEHIDVEKFYRQTQIIRSIAAAGEDGLSANRQLCDVSAVRIAENADQDAGGRDAEQAGLANRCAAKDRADLEASRRLHGDFVIAAKAKRFVGRENS